MILILAALMVLAAPALAESEDTAAHAVSNDNASPAAPQGPSDGGGGDPRATEFIRIARVMVLKMAAFPLIAQEELGSPRQYSAFIARAETSLEGHSPLIQFTDTDTVPCFGAPKAACVENGVIHVAGAWWSAASSKQRIELVIMEVMKSLDLPGRYKFGPILAKAITKEDVDDLLSMSALGDRMERLARLGRVPQAQDLLVSAWSCDRYSWTGVTHIENAFRFERDPADPTKLRNTGTLLGTNDTFGLSVGSDGRVRRPSGVHSLTMLRSHTLLIESQVKHPRRRRDCTNCGSQTSNSLTSLQEVNRVISQEGEKYYFHCHPDQRADATSATAR